jgi:hypothetical protein
MANTVPRLFNHRHFHNIRLIKVIPNQVGIDPGREVAYVEGGIVFSVKIDVFFGDYFSRNIKNQQF